MEFLIALFFIVGCVIFYYRTTLDTEKDFHERRVKKLEEKINRLEFEKKWEKKKDSDFIKKMMTKEIYTHEQIERSKRAIEKISNKLGKPATLEDLVRYSIEARGLEITEQEFQGLVRMSDAAGLDVLNIREIYDKYLIAKVKIKDPFNLHGDPLSEDS